MVAMRLEGGVALDDPLPTPLLRISSFIKLTFIACVLRTIRTPQPTLPGVIICDISMGDRTEALVAEGDFALRINIVFSSPPQIPVLQLLGSLSMTSGQVTCPPPPRAQPGKPSITAIGC